MAYIQEFENKTNEGGKNQGQTWWTLKSKERGRARYQKKKEMEKKATVLYRKKRTLRNVKAKKYL